MRLLAVLETAMEVNGLALSRSNRWLDGSERWVEWRALALRLPSHRVECAAHSDEGVAAVVQVFCAAMDMARNECAFVDGDQRRALFELVEQCRKLAMLYGTPELVEKLAGVWRAFE